MTGELSPIDKAKFVAAKRAVDFVFLLDEGVIDDEDGDTFWFAESAQEAWQGILDWYEQCGEPLIPPDLSGQNKP